MSSICNETSLFMHDLTQERLEQWWALPTDRQRFVWALQTETRVRAHKVQRQDEKSRSLTLQSNLLFDIYHPPHEEDNFVCERYPPQIPRRDISLYRRKVNDSVFAHQTHAREPNGEFNALAYPLDLKLRNDFCYEENAPIVPSNMLFFEMLLEAYCGYPMQGYFHHVDSSMPRAAIMGGAVLAAFMAWRDAHVRNMKEWQHLDQWFATNNNSNDPLEYDSYEVITERLQRQLQDYFYEDKSFAFVAGDVDVFLQPPPLTRSLTCHLARHGINGDLLQRVAEFMGGFELCEGDLERMSTDLCDNLIVPTFENIGPLIYSATRRGLSFALSQHDNPENDQCLERERWPRNTQLIILNERADLLGALFDFDISVAAFAYDGIQVRAAPRALLSLLTNVLVVTPFVLAEKRNRQRIVKYCKRGFRPFMLDPFCSHPRQCRHDCCDIVQRVSPMDDGNAYFPNEVWHSSSFDSHGTRENPRNFWEQQRPVCNCSYNRRFFEEEFDDHLGGSRIYKYTFGVIAKTDDHLFDFLAKKNQWSLEHQASVRSIHPMARMICPHCRDAYILYLLLPMAPPDFGDSIDDLLHGEMCYVRGGFYAGGSFDSTAVRARARSASAYMDALQNQAKVERFKYWIRHGSYDGYKQRFAFGNELKNLLGQASKINFAEPRRPPLGLNPERFMEECEHCQKEMPGLEYGTRICEDCLSRGAPR